MSKYEQLYNDNKSAFIDRFWGIECGDGWYHLVEPLVKYVSDYNNKIEDKDDHILIIQIKEKYAGLRFYTSTETEELGKLISEAEELSYKTCETCGKDGKVVGKGWIYTACEEHDRTKDVK